MQGSTGRQPEPDAQEPTLPAGSVSPSSAGVDYVVGIGASAGGLEALQELSRHLKALGHVTFVVAQHLSPDHPSLLVDLLSHSTPLSVVEAIDGAELQADVIAIAPPNHDVVVEGNHLRLSTPMPRFGPSPCIDLLFESIADQWGDHSLAIVLSGTGADGARGVRAVRAAGGLTVAQAPESAKFSAMPTAAISLGCADLVLEASAIGLKIGEWTSHEGNSIDGSKPAPAPALLSSVIEHLKQATGIDFCQYKGSTLNRQLQRRMQSKQITTLHDYLLLLSSDPGEARALVQNLLVSVTSFFRDPEAFTALGDHLKVYVGQHGSTEPLRIWVPGCATGEEVFSLAMLLSEVLGHPAHLASQIKIFGTDLDDVSLSVCRRGVYPLSEAKAIPDHLRDRFVIETETELEMTEELRSCTVFARHDVGADPPFPRLDLVSCRNTLIYFTAPMKERVLNLFRFGLVPGGLLFLGSSESLASRTPGFKLLNPEQRIYMRTPEGSRRPRHSLALPEPRGPIAYAPLERVASLRESVPEQHVALLESLIRLISKPCLVLDENHDLIEVIGDVTPFCRLPEGRVSTAATAFLLPELQSEARALFLLTRADGLAIRSAGLPLEGRTDPIHLEVKPFQVGERNLWLLTFLETAESATGSAIARPQGLLPGQAFDRELERLEQELLSSQNNLRRSLNELEQVNEELEASSEELQASSEELQSSNEELEASNEELQATNEELGTLNQQLRARSDDLEKMNMDLENIQNSLSQGMVIVDRHLCILRYSPLAVRVFGLVHSDHGQPLLDIPTTLPLPGLEEALLAVIRGELRQSIEASSEDVSYLIQILPYQQQDGRRLGAIVTLTDVSELVALRRAAEASLSEFSNLTDALEQAVLKWDPTMQHLLYASQRIQAITGWSAAELCDQPRLLEAAIHPDDRASVRVARDLNQLHWSVRYRMRTRDGRSVWVAESCRVVHDVEEGFIVGTLSDVSGIEVLESKSRHLSAIFETVFHAHSIGVAVLDESLRLIQANASFCRFTGHDQTSLVGVHADLLSAPADPQSLSTLAAAALAGSGSTGQGTVLRLKLADGSLLSLEAEIRTTTDPAVGSLITVIVPAGPGEQLTSPGPRIL